MSAAGAPPRRIAVLDVGKTNVKVVLFDGVSGAEVWTRTLPNAPRRDGPYPHADTAAIEAFTLDALADLAREHGFDAVSITTHGAAGALLAGDALAMPVLDYEHDGPERTAEAYGRLRPAFAETFSPRLPGGLNLGAQLFWQAHAFPEHFARATRFVTYPQYWAHRLTGVAATEATSLGTHTDLWAPRERRFSTLVARAGWQDLMAPVRSAFDVLGPMTPALSRRLGLSQAVPVGCGIHDSNASLLPHVQAADGALSVVSTGTWVVVFALGGDLARLDPRRDTLANVDAFGRPVPSARFMGGREYDRLTAGADGPVPDAVLARVLADGVMALPSFAPGSGPFPDRGGRWSHDPDTLTSGERVAAASLYGALMTAACLELLKADGRTVVEGPFARNALFCAALATLSGRAVHPARGGTGTSAGAARLLHPADAAPATSEAPPLTPLHAAALHAYAARWREQASAA